MKEAVAAYIRAMFNASDRKSAEEHQKAAIQNYAITAPRFSVWMEDNLAEGLLAVFQKSLIVFALFLLF